MTHFLNLSSFVWGISLTLSLSAEVTLKSQVFFGDVSVEVNPSTETPYISLFQADSFEAPIFDFSKSAIKETISSPSWLHVAKSKDKNENHHFSSHYFLPAIEREFQTFRTHLPVVVIDCADAPSIDSYDYQDCFWGIMIPENEKVFPGQSASNFLHAELNALSRVPGNQTPWMIGASNNFCNRGCSSMISERGALFLNHTARSRGRRLAVFPRPTAQ